MIKTVHLTNAYHPQSGAFARSTGPSSTKRTGTDVPFA